MPSFSFAPGRGGPFHWPKRPSEEFRCCGVLEGGGPALVSRECPRGGNLPAPPGGSSFGGGVLGGVPAASALFFLSWGGFCRGFSGGMGFCGALGVGRVLPVGWVWGWWGGVGGGGGGVEFLWGVFWCGCGCVVPLSGLSSCPPYPFSVLLLFCALCYVCSRVAELQCCAGLVGLILWLLPLASRGLLLCGVVLGGCWWVGCFCGCLVFVGWLGLWVSGCLSVHPHL